MAKKTRYKKLIITANALVPKGAVQEKAVFKGIEFGQLKQLSNIIKDDNNQTMYSIWYPLNKVDAHGDFVDNPAVLENAAIDFMKSGEKSIKILHEGNFTDGAVVKELWIVKAGDPIFTNPDLIGSLAGGIKFLDAELYNKCKSENWETSIEGQAEEEVVEKSMIEDLKDFIKNLFCKSQNINYFKEKLKVKDDVMDVSKDYNDQKYADEICKKLWTLRDSIDRVLYDNTIQGENKKTEIDKNIQQFVSDIAGEQMQKAGENMPTKEEFDALSAKVAELEAKLSAKEPEMTDDEKTAATTKPAEPDPEKEELKKSLELKTAEAEKLKAELEKEVKKSVQVKENKTESSEKVIKGILGEYKIK